MLFLLNDTVIELDDGAPDPAHAPEGFTPVDLYAAIELACTLFSQDPDMHRTQPQKAYRLAWLIANLSGGLNAALFCAPGKGCLPELVEPRFCALPEPVMIQLQQRQLAGKLDALSADRTVWGRLAA